jgi:hypothetical protein
MSTHYKDELQLEQPVGHLEKRSISEQDCDLFMKHDLNGRVLLPSRVVSLLYLVAALKNR